MGALYFLSSVLLLLLWLLHQSIYFCLTVFLSGFMLLSLSLSHPTFLHFHIFSIWSSLNRPFIDLSG